MVIRVDFQSRLCLVLFFLHHDFGEQIYRFRKPDFGSRFWTLLRFFFASKSPQECGPCRSKIWTSKTHYFEIWEPKQPPIQISYSHRAPWQCWLASWGIFFFAIKIFGEYQDDFLIRNGWLPVGCAKISNSRNWSSFIVIGSVTGDAFFSRKRRSHLL